MSSRRKTAIRAWRVYRGLTLRQLADLINAPRDAPLTSYASLGRIERGIQPYSQDTLEAIAAALEVDPFVLLTPDDPAQAETIAALWLQLSPSQRRLALALLQAILDARS